MKAPDTYTEFETFEFQGRISEFGSWAVEKLRSYLDDSEPAPILPVEINEGDERLIVLRFQGDTLEIGQATVIWDTPYMPLRAGCQWRKYSLPHGNDAELANLIETVRASRLQEFNECRFCKRMVPKEHRIESDVCHGCGSEHLGVVY